MSEKNLPNNIGEIIEFSGEIPTNRTTITDLYNLPPTADAPPISPTPSALTLPTDSKERKEIPMASGCLNYFPAALAGVARISKAGNDKHNPGQPLHHARGKSNDHADCILRHFVDVQDLLASDKRGALTPKGRQELLTEVSSLAWRALAYSQELHEQFEGAPLAPGARLSKE